MKIKILNSAKEDLIEGFHFYESQKQGIGKYFLDSLYSDIESLQLFAGIHSIHFNNYYRLLSKRFPFAIYYRIEENEIRIYAALDCRRDPAWIRSRMQ
ncbi:MAG: type II toxin-antitoxin system RelE/ParE family toxin [Calditrichaeota bacterium]|nr:MAG: type II toxin-antitoxin system RelE/ParE family toxin [Calditrichota bacterium]MBL1204539.1 type II toxin-antitoxin system RelE/ParE family toxin [Calditrichota bacterium]NOG44367.1 type II toxin-antitoxin system RelE/ParE family toxin [Calditrichota bacterium]